MYKLLRFLPVLLPLLARFLRSRRGGPATGRTTPRR